MAHIDRKPLCDGVDLFLRDRNLQKQSNLNYNLLSLNLPFWSRPAFKLNTFVACTIQPLAMTLPQTQHSVVLPYQPTKRV